VGPDHGDPKEAYTSLVRSRAGFLVGVLALTASLGGVTANSVAAATSTTVTWKVSSLTAGQVKSLSAIATTNSTGVKTWSKTGSCTLTPKSKPTKLTMGSTGSCVLTLKIAKSGNYRAKTSSKTITRKTYKVGQTGPGGGKIFYVDLTRPAGSKYFEAACAGWQNNCDGKTADPEAKWMIGSSGAGADGTAIGTGEQNTAEIVDMDYATAGIAGRLADAYSNGGQSDWFLPSPDELNQMYIQRYALGYFHRLGCWGDRYWSSSQFISDYYGAGVEAWAYDFRDGTNYFNLFQDNTACVWPVRSF